MWNDLLIFCLVVFLINGMLLMLLCMLNEKCKFGFCKQTGTRTTLYSEQLSSWASAEHVRLSNNAHTHGILPFGFGKQSWTQIAICGPFEGFGFCDDWQWLKQNYKVLILGVVYWPLGSVATQRPRLPPWQSYIVRYTPYIQRRRQTHYKQQAFLWKVFGDIIQTSTFIRISILVLVYITSN